VVGVVTATATLAVTVVTLACFTGLGLWYVRRRGGVRTAEEFVSARNSTGVGAAGVSALVAVASAPVTDADFDLDRLSTAVRRFDDRADDSAD
jgi:hypothetical protein